MSVLPILLLIFFFVIIGVVLSSTYPTSIYEKQEKEYFKRQKNYYKNINRLIKKYTKYRLVDFAVLFNLKGSHYLQMI